MRLFHSNCAGVIATNVTVGKNVNVQAANRGRVSLKHTTLADGTSVFADAGGTALEPGQPAGAEFGPTNKAGFCRLWECDCGVQGGQPVGIHVEGMLIAERVEFGSGVQVVVPDGVRLEMDSINNRQKIKVDRSLVFDPARIPERGLWFQIKTQMELEKLQALLGAHEGPIAGQQGHRLSSLDPVLNAPKWLGFPGSVRGTSNQSHVD